MTSEPHTPYEMITIQRRGFTDLYPVTSDKGAEHVTYTFDVDLLPGMYDSYEANGLIIFKYVNGTDEFVK